VTRRLLLRAHAKVNYALEVVGVRGDGYHEIRTVMQSVSLADDVEIERASEGFELHFEPEGVEIGPLEENTVYRAWALLWEATGSQLPVRIRLHKKVPPGAGLGGGSADAAAVLVGMNALFDLGLRTQELHGIGTRIGADIPFCLAGGTALGEGIGEVLTPLPAPPAHYLVLAKPSRSADTGEIYRSYDGAGPRANAPCVEPVISALRAGDVAALGAAVGNDLEPVTRGLVAEVEAYERELLDAGALGAAMTGTGTAVYGIFGSEDDARQAASRIGRAPFAGAFEPFSRGVEIL
jgi:4-diphosphocytidyl-2-C-methyl-D-erythritol kinase